MDSLQNFFNKSVELSLTASQYEAIISLDDFFQSKINCFILKGYAGTGKTTLLHGITRYLLRINRNFVLMAPTGRAAKVISEKTGQSAYTIHKSIYSMDKLEEYKSTNEDGSATFKFSYGLRNNSDPINTIYIIDESSMISNQYSEGEFFRFGSGHLLQDMLQYIAPISPVMNKQILIIGDPAQLPPVHMNSSPALDIDYVKNDLGLNVRQMEMVHVARQEQSSGILVNATSTRKKISDKKFNSLSIDTNYNDIDEINLEDIIKKYFSMSDNKTIIAYSNKSVQRYNKAIREHVFSNKDDIQIGDVVIVIQNNYQFGVLNGEFGIIKKIHTSSENISVGLRTKEGEDNINVKLVFKDICLRVENLQGETMDIDCKIIENLLNSDKPRLSSIEQRALYVDFRTRAKERGLVPKSPEYKEAIRTDPYFNALQIKYGYAITCHKAQGGEWDDCIVDFETSMPDNSESYFRWCYTAMTRSKSLLSCLNAPKLSPTSTLQIKRKSTNPPVLNYAPVNIDSEIPKHLKLNLPLEMALYSMVHNKINKNISILDIKHRPWVERYFFNTEPEKTEIDFYYNKKNLITSILAIRSGTGAENILQELNSFIGKNISLVQEVDNNAIIFPENKPYLSDFYKDIKNRLDASDIIIDKIDHLEYCEKYYFILKDELAVIQFYYNKDGIFKKIISDNHATTSQNLVNKVLNSLK